MVKRLLGMFLADPYAMSGTGSGESQGCGTLIHEFQEWSDLGALAEFRLGDESRHSVKQGLGLLRGLQGLMAVNGIAEGPAAGLQFSWQCIPIQTAIAFELPARPLIHRFNLMFTAMGQPQVEVTGLARILHQHHQQALLAANQSNGFQCGFPPGGVGDQAHQSREIGEPPRHVLKQVIKGCPAQAELGELLIEMLGDCSRSREQAIHVMPVSARAWNPSCRGVWLRQETPLL